MTAETVGDVELDKLAKLSRLAILPEERELFKQKLASTLEWVEMLAQVDTAGVEPMYTPVQTNLTLRDDVVESQSTQDVMQNAPLVEYDHFLVPKIIEE